MDRYAMLEEESRPALAWYEDASEWFSVSCREWLGTEMTLRGVTRSITVITLMLECQRRRVEH